MWRVSGALTHSQNDHSWPGEQPQKAIDTGSVFQQIRGRCHEAGQKKPWGTEAAAPPTAQLQDQEPSAAMGVKDASTVAESFPGCCCPEPAGGSSKMLLLKAQPPVQALSHQPSHSGTQTSDRTSDKGTAGHKSM